MLSNDVYNTRHSWSQSPRQPCLTLGIRGRDDGGRSGSSGCSARRTCRCSRSPDSARRSCSCTSFRSFATERRSFGLNRFRRSDDDFRTKARGRLAGSKRALARRSRIVLCLICRSYVSLKEVAWISRQVTLRDMPRIPFYESGRGSKLKKQYRIFTKPLLNYPNCACRLLKS